MSCHLLSRAFRVAGLDKIVHKPDRMVFCTLTNHLLPCFSGLVNCSVELLNAGAVQLSTVTITGQAACSDLGTLAPGESTSCTISYPLTYQNFYDWDEAGQPVLVRVDATAAPPSGSSMVMVKTSGNVSLPLTAQRSVVLDNIAITSPQAPADAEGAE